MQDYISDTQYQNYNQCDVMPTFHNLESYKLNGRLQVDYCHSVNGGCHTGKIRLFAGETIEDPFCTIGFDTTSDGTQPFADSCIYLSNKQRLPRNSTPSTKVSSLRSFTDHFSFSPLDPLQNNASQMGPPEGGPKRFAPGSFSNSPAIRHQLELRHDAVFHPIQGYRSSNGTGYGS
jgi:hypothetical protein